MISLSIDRTSLGKLPLTIVDSGRTTGTYVLQSWNPGAIVRDNTVATSRWLSGGRLTSTRDDVVSMDMVVRLWASSTVTLRTMADELGEALGQFDYTITESGMTFAAVTYDCMPASYSMEFDPAQLRQYTALVTASVPRQP